MPSLVDVLDAAGVFAFALSGAALAARHRLDMVGAVALALVTGLAGGVLRDLLIGDTPPAAFDRQYPLLIPLLAALVVVVSPRLLGHFRRPVILFDSIGLGIFTVVGATRAVDAGLGPVAATVIGALSAVGGGVIRDVLVRRTPTVFTPNSGLYVIPASLGALVTALGHRYLQSGPADAAAIISVAAAVGTMAIRFLSLRFGWSTPRLNPIPALDDL